MKKDESKRQGSTSGPSASGVSGRLPNSEFESVVADLARVPKSEIVELERNIVKKRSPKRHPK